MKMASAWTSQDTAMSQSTRRGSRLVNMDQLEIFVGPQLMQLTGPVAKSQFHGGLSRTSLYNKSYCDCDAINLCEWGLLYKCSLMLVLSRVTSDGVSTDGFFISGLRNLQFDTVLHVEEQDRVRDLQRNIVAYTRTDPSQANKIKGNF